MGSVLMLQKVFISLYLSLLASLLAVAATTAEAERHTTTTAADFGMTIIGTIISKDNNNVVLIKFKETGMVRAHRLGFNIYKKYTLHEIQSNFIVLTSNEAGQTTYTKVFKDGFVDTVASKQHAAPAAAGFQDSYQEDGFERHKNTIEMSETYRDKLIQQDLPKILMQASAEPVIENGQMIGFLLDQIDPSSIFAKSGMQNGDIITAINDISLQDVTATIKLLHSLKNAKEISAELRRNGKATSLQVKIK